MSAFLENYGAGEERRERIIKRIALSVLLLAVMGGILYYNFRNYKEERQSRLFFERLQAQDYEGAYQTWGCTPDTPCRDYSFEKFMEDWGPQSPHADLTALSVKTSRSCENGIIQTATFASGDSVMLWVERSDLSLGFAPWPVCNPRIPAP
ncbi:MAG: hypothetical protein ACK5AZ_02120 [Bryobacteraceae bacterium]